jgi:5-methyltetrahydrofolate--homocysteine methyltransferase
MQLPSPAAGARKESIVFIIGAVINTSVEGIDGMIEKRDKAELLRLARMQIDYGADMLAVNCGSRIESEADDIEWMFRTIQDELEIPLCIDSPNPEAHAAGLKVHRHGRPMVNSITAEQKRMHAILPLVREYGATVTAILHDESGIPGDVEGRLRVVPTIENAIKEHGIDPQEVYLDCMVFPLSVRSDNGQVYLQALQRVRREYPQFKTICGLNNISYGLPRPDILNTSFLSMCAAAGQDAAYVEISRATGAFARGIHALTGADDYCKGYISSYRASKLEVLQEEPPREEREWPPQRRPADT